jgi:hypothetical protein
VCKSWNGKFKGSIKTRLVLCEDVCSGPTDLRLAHVTWLKPRVKQVRTLEFLTAKLRRMYHFQGAAADWNESEWIDAI